MRVALIARPQWQDRQAASPAASRLIAAPLQRLQLCEPNSKVFEALRRASNPWIVFTSPASVEAVDQWIHRTGINPMQLSALRVAAVGSGTRQAIIDKAQHHRSDRADAWAINPDQITVSAADERADAEQLLVALDHTQRQEGFAWPSQTFLLAQGKANRPTLADGLSQRGAHVMPMAMYRRKDVAWPDQLWESISKSASQEYGVVVTSSAVITRLIVDAAAHGVAPSHMVWCTQHASIAEKIRDAGISRVRRVSLDAVNLERDFFDQERYW